MSNKLRVYERTVTRSKISGMGEWTKGYKFIGYMDQEGLTVDEVSPIYGNRHLVSSVTVIDEFDPEGFQINGYDLDTVIADLNMHSELADESARNISRTTLLEKYGMPLTSLSYLYYRMVEQQEDATVP